MNLFTLLRKKIFGDKIDLHQPVLDRGSNNGEKLIITTTVIVKKDLEGRIDLICQEYYGTVNVIDYVLKANNISDPFSIKEGDEIKLPNLSTINYTPPKARDSINKEINSQGETSLKDRLDKVEREIRQQADERRSEFLKRKQLRKQEIAKKYKGLPPNFIKRPNENN